MNDVVREPLSINYFHADICWKKFHNSSVTKFKKCEQILIIMAKCSIAMGLAVFFGLATIGFMVSTIILATEDPETVTKMVDLNTKKPKLAPTPTVSSSKCTSAFLVTS